LFAVDVAGADGLPASTQRDNTIRQALKG